MKFFHLSDRPSSFAYDQDFADILTGGGDCTNPRCDLPHVAVHTTPLAPRGDGKPVKQWEIT